MSDAGWVVVLILSAALLPAVLLGLAFAGDRALRHPRYRALRWKLYEFQRARPAAFAGMYAVLMLPAVGYFAVNSRWLMVGLFVLQGVGAYYTAGRAVPPFVDDVD